MSHRIELKARSNQHYVYSGRSLLVTNLDGWISGAGTEGFYNRNTRLLSREELLVDGMRPKPAAVSPVGGDAFLAYYEAEQTGSIPKQSIYLEVRRAVENGLRSEYQLTNFHRDKAIAFSVAVVLDADFADSDEAETGGRRQSASINRAWLPERKEISFTYCHPEINRQSLLQYQSNSLEPRFVGDRLELNVSLQPHTSVQFSLTLTPVFDGSTSPAPALVFPRPREGLPGLRSDIAAETPDLVSSSDTVNRAWRTAVSDLASLSLDLPSTPAVPIAGLPLYQQFFGRDSLTIAWQSLLATKRMMRDTLLANAAWQGVKIDDFYDEEPGKMIHQARCGPLSELRLDAFLHYYGDWATPVDFLIMLGQYLLWTDDAELVRKLLPAARAALTWIENYGDKDRDGFLEYESRSPKGVKHQGWKDSDDAIVNKRGELIEPPIAASEIQAYWYAGLQQTALAFLRCGDPGFAAQLLGEARALRKRFDRAFWLESERFYAMAIAPGRGLADSISSNAGHLLATGIVPLEKARLVADRLMQPEMFSGWGIRTLSTHNPFFNPFSYHRGSVWPVEQGTIAFGFARYGLWDHLHTLAKGFFDLTDLFVANRLPEVVAGIQRDAEHPHPGIYPNSCEPQGWSASMIVLLIQSLLGLRPIAPARLLIIDPHLPDWMPELLVKDLRVGDSRVDLRFKRTSSGETKYEAHKREGGVRVIRQPVPDSRPSLAARAKALLA